MEDAAEYPRAPRKLQRLERCAVPSKGASRSPGHVRSSLDGLKSSPTCNFSTLAAFERRTGVTAIGRRHVHFFAYRRGCPTPRLSRIAVGVRISLASDLSPASAWSRSHQAA